MKHTLLPVAACALSLPFFTAPLCAAGESQPPAEQERLERIKWWRDGRFGLFIHWGLYAIPAGTWKESVHKTGYSEWIMFDEKIPVPEYSALARKFNPEKFDADAWVAVAKAAGMKYVVLTAKHHDGFSMFGSEHTSYDIVDATPYQRDVTAELATACRKAGLRFGCYYSVDRDWYRPTGPGNRLKQTNHWDYPDSPAKDFDTYFTSFAKPQVEELLTRYDIDLLWFDGIDMKSPQQAEALYQSIRRLKPSCIINSRIRTFTKPKQMPPPQCDYMSSGDNQILESGVGFEWENPGSMNTSFGFNKHDDNWVEPKTVIHRLVDSASKNGNYLLNVGPTAEGLIPQACIDRLSEVGEWLKVNGEAIYGTMPREIEGVDSSVDFRVLSKDTTIYAICLEKPADKWKIGKLRVVKTVTLLGSETPVEWHRSKDGTLLVSPPPESESSHAFVYRVTCGQ